MSNQAWRRPRKNDQISKLQQACGGAAQVVEADCMILQTLVEFIESDPEVRDSLEAYSPNAYDKIVDVLDTNETAIDDLRKIARMTL